MRRIFAVIGWLTFWITWPALFIYLRNTRRSRVFIRYGDELLVVKGWLGRNLWQLPGGGLHKNEDVLNGTIREIHEETGITVAIDQVHHIGTRRLVTTGIPYHGEYALITFDTRPTVTHQKYEIRSSMWLPINQITTKNVANGDIVLELLVSNEA